MKNILSYTFAALIAVIACSCNDNIDVKQEYSFDLYALPVPKRITQGETVEIRCQILKEGNFAGNAFYIRYFQSEGKGALRLDDGREMTPNDLFPLKSDVFRLYFTSMSAERQVIDLYVENSFGQVVEKNFSFSNENVLEAKE